MSFITRYPIPDTRYPTSLPRIQNLLVDLGALARIAHLYDPVRCKKRGCCCSSYEVTVGRREMERITGCMPHAARHAPWLRDGKDWVNPFEEDEARQIVLDTDEHGRCVFAYRNASGETRCSLHTAAIELGLDPYRTKPRSCALWPLALGEGRPRVLSIQDDAFDFPCNRRRRPRRDRSLDPGIAELIQLNFGRPFLSKVLERLSKHP